MHRLTFSDLPRLVDANEEACVSLYVGGGRSGLFSGPTLQTYRHSLRRAEAALRTRSRKEVRDRLLESLRVFSSLQSVAPRARGLAVFSSPTLSGWIPFQEPVETSLVVAESFHIKPLLPFLDDTQRWYLLDLRSDHARLHECARGQGEEAGRCLVGVERARRKEDGAARIMRWVEARFPLDPVPLVVRAPSDLEPLLAPLAAKSTLPDPFLHDPTTVLHDDVLVEGVWARVRPHLDAKRARLLARMRQEATNGRALTSPHDVLGRLRERRLSTIALRAEAHLWGAIDWKKGRIALARDLGRDRGEPFGDCVLDDIAERALRERCRVMVAGPGELPPGADLVAL